MKAVTKFVAGGIVAAALVSAAPAAAQYYPGNPYGYGYGGGDVIGQVISQVLGGGYGYGHRANSQVVVNQCVNAVQARLARNYGGNHGYGYGYAPYSNARVLGITRVEPRANGGLTVRGVASSGQVMAYGYGYGGQQPADLTFRCRADYRGYVVDVDLDRINSSYGYNSTPYTPYNYDYSQYGYRRY